jgi:aminomethyltransferase
MVPFAGYEMPVQYSEGVLKEHLHTRTAAGLFDVSHMGQMALRPRSGNVADAARALERLVSADIVSLRPGHQRYALLTVESGGISDDLMAAHAGPYLFLVVNASRKAEDEALLRAGLEDACDVDVLNDRALLAIQGPKAEAALSPHAPGVASMKFMDARWETVRGIECFVSRSGYTGEDGFEISVPAAQAGDLWDALLQNSDVQPIGLGARDSLRLEAGLCLYGNDIDLSTTPVEAALEWSIQKSRRFGGFPGAAVILPQLASGASRRRVGLKPESRPIRAGAPLYATEASPEQIGTVSSGGFGPTVDGPISMGYVPTKLATPGIRLYAEVRGERHPVSVVQLPFVANRYKR